MKIACSALYIQSETLAQIAIIVYFYLCSSFQELAMQNAK